MHDDADRAPVFRDAHPPPGVFPQGDAHVLCSSPQLPAILDMSLYTPPFTDLPLVYDRADPGAEHSRILCCFLGCEESPFNPLLTALPRVMRLPGSDDQARTGWLGTLLNIAASEAARTRAGGDRPAPCKKAARYETGAASMPSRSVSRFPSPSPVSPYRVRASKILTALSLSGRRRSARATGSPRGRRFLRMPESGLARRHSRFRLRKPAGQTKIPRLVSPGAAPEPVIASCCDGIPG